MLLGGLGGEDGELDDGDVGGGVDEEEGDEDAVVPAAGAVEDGLEAFLLEGGLDLGGDGWGAGGVVLEGVGLPGEAAVVVEEVVAGAGRDVRGALGPVSGDDDDGAGSLGGVELEDLGDAIRERADDVLMARVTEDGEGPWRGWSVR